MGQYRNYTEGEFKKAVRDSTSIRQVLSKLGLAQAGGNYHSAKERIIKLELDVSHHLGKASNKEKIFGPKRELKEYLTQNGVQISSHGLRLRLIKENIFKPVCSSCKLKIWKNKPIPLELDHIDGNRKDNRLKNLRLLCPNCHAMTDTYRGKNKGKW